MTAAAAQPVFTFDPERHAYFNAQGREVPSVTTVLDGCGFTDFEFVPADTLENKRKLGDAVHFATKLIDESGDLDWDTVHAKCVPYVLAYETAVKELGFTAEPEWIERSGVYVLNGMEFGYTVDRVGRFRGIKHRCVLEIKCSYQEEVGWRYQTAAYSKVVAKEGEHIGRFALQLKPDGTFKLMPPYQNPRDIDVFRYSLAITHEKIREGLRWRRREDGNRNAATS